MKVLTLTANADNYMYLLYDSRKNAAVVDPCDYLKVIDAVEELQLNLTHVLTTHHHWDHADGNAAIQSYKPGIIVCGGDGRVNVMTKQVEDGSTLEIGSILVNCIKTPGHTSGHICYFATDRLGNDPASVFTGDTLFIAGCGKFFEGTPSDMYGSLIGKLALLPPDTLVYPGHEYTVTNLKFGLSVDPENLDISKKLTLAIENRAENKPTVPSTIGEELLHNVFMRVNNISFLNKFNLNSSVDLMGYLRELKNSFKTF